MEEQVQRQHREVNPINFSLGNTRERVAFLGEHEFVTEMLPTLPGWLKCGVQLLHLLYSLATTERKAFRKK